VGDLAGAAIAVIIITLVRGLPDRAEREEARPEAVADKVAQVPEATGS
jgi:hypothetical protein